MSSSNIPDTSWDSQAYDDAGAAVREEMEIVETYT
jgi:hypothetical protein